MTDIDPKSLRKAFGSFLTGVTVVTTVDNDGNRYGFTANSFTSVSIDPPLLLVCPGKFLSSYSAFSTCKHFAVNILAEGQEDVANVFAGFKGDRFAQVEWHADATGNPVIEGAVASFSCDTHQILPAGDHVILIGEVTGFTNNEERGLGYSSGRFFSLAMEREAAAAHSEGSHIAGAIIEWDGKILLEHTENGYSLPHVQVQNDLSARQALQKHFLQRSQDVTFGKAFSIFSDRPTNTRYTYIQATTTDLSGTWIPIEKLNTLPMRSETQKTMLSRYALERSTGHFGLYVGDEQNGDIHNFSEGT